MTIQDFLTQFPSALYLSELSTTSGDRTIIYFADNKIFAFNKDVLVKVDDIAGHLL